MGMESPQGTEEITVRASQIAEGFLRNFMERNGIDLHDTNTAEAEANAQKKAAYLDAQAEVFRNSHNGLFVTFDYKDINMTPELRDAMVAWCEGAAKNLRGENKKM